VKISNKKKIFFPSLNQYFPHIPYVSSKKLMRKLGAWILSTYCKLCVRDLQTSDFVLKNTKDSHISKFWVRSIVPGPRITDQKCHQIYSTVKFAETFISHSESEFVWEVPLELIIFNFWVRNYLLNTKSGKIRHATILMS
jgi:hypothetical protein